MAILRILTVAIATSILIGLSGCGTTQKQLVTRDISQVNLRSMQTRAFDTTDENKTLRAIIATLQDFGFVITKADEALGTITARRIDKYSLRITVTVRTRGETQVLVRMNGYYGRHGIYLIHQNFFTSLEKSMFLTAHSVD